MVGKSPRRPSVRLGAEVRTGVAMVRRIAVHAACCWMLIAAVGCAMPAEDPGRSVGLASEALSATDCPVGYNIIQGTNASETLIGTAGNDCIVAKSGNDTVYGRGGNDFLIGGDGSDTLYGEAGSDVLHGEAGADRLEGGDGNDTLYGGLNIDSLYGQNDDDQLYGDASGDTLEGGLGNDFLRGGDGDDILRGGDGDAVGCQRDAIRAAVLLGAGKGREAHERREDECFFHGWYSFL